MLKSNIFLSKWLLMRLKVAAIWASLLISSGTTLYSQDIRELSIQFPGSETPVDVMVEVRGKLVYLEDDMILGKTEELFGTDGRAAIVSYIDRRWPNATMPYTIDASFSNAQLNAILEAIEYVNEKTNLTLVERNSSHSDYVRFKLSDVNSSFVGRQTWDEEQIINIVSPSMGVVVHEIFHAAGFFHEQSREDRDIYVTVHEDNIVPGKENNFQKYFPEGGFDHGPYDYGSIMHYGTHYFTSNGQPTITVNSPPAPHGTTIGQRDTLSQGDIDAMNAIYPCASDEPLFLCGNDANSNFETGKSIVASPNGCNTTIATNSNYLWVAGKYIDFKPGFTVSNVEDFSAVVEWTCYPVHDAAYLLSEKNDKMEQEVNLADESTTGSSPENKPEVSNTPAYYLRVFPNPLQNYANITFELPHSTEVNLQVFDVYGKLIHQERIVYHSGLQEVNFDGSQLPKGMYTVVLSFDNNILSERMVVN